MRAVVQRVTGASVIIDAQRRTSIGPGLLVYLGVGRGDDDADLRYIVEKIASLRVFADDNDKMNRSVVDARGEVLVVPAFTVQADARKGRRPAFDAAAEPEVARQLFTRVCAALESAGLSVERGVFGAHMAVEAVNDGPVCILLDTKRAF